MSKNIFNSITLRYKVKFYFFVFKREAVKISFDLFLPSIRAD